MNEIQIRLPSAEVARKALVKLSNEIDRAPSLAAVEQIANAAAGYQRAFKPVKDVADQAGEVWINADAKIGQELERIGKSKGGKPYQKKYTGSKVIPVKPSNKELGLTKKRAARARKLASIPKTELKKIIQKLKDEGKGVTPNAILAAARKEVKEHKVHKVAIAKFSKTGPFGVIVIDPPWPMQKIDRDERPNQDAFDYPVMKITELESFWKDKIQKQTTKDCHLFCWTTQKFLPDAIRFIEQWGFRYVLTMVWHKPGGFQPIGLPQYNCEFIVYARHGSPVFTNTKEFNCCNNWPRREHSRKPNGFYELIKRVTGGSRLDVFAREAHDGFAQYGNETEKFKGEQS